MNAERWQHAHSFGQEHRRPGESRTLIVIAITAAMMVVEVTAGIVYGSMALLADGLHMASHAAALGITAMAYIYARRHAHDARYSFGTGKVNALGGFTGAVLLGVFALMMGWQSIARLVNPVDIAFNQAIFVAVLGLIVNGASIVILGVKDHDHGHSHGHDHHHGNQDHALRSAYFHVMADALTSLLAIFALLAAKYFGLVWMDPMMGIVGTILVSRWSYGLLRDTSKILLDRQGHDELCNAIRNSIEKYENDEITDLHVWSVGPNIHAAIVSLATKHPRPPDHYKAMLPDDLGLVHVNIEVHHADEVSTSRRDS
jgi:cation diffusion facilitator family transporter